MITVADIKEKLPNWPDAVMQEWLLYFANDIGWPPAEPLGTDRWGGILGNRPLSWWADVAWEEQNSDCSFAELSRATKVRVADVVNSINTGAADAETQRRYQRPFNYIASRGVFPNPMVAMRVSDGLRFIDGHHRLAAFMNLQNAPQDFFDQNGLHRPSVQQAVWIGMHANGELPLA